MQRTRTWNMDQPVLRGRNRVLPIEGGDGSTLSLDFTSMSSLDSRFTFSRSSTATFINSSGFVKYADHNFVINSVFGSTVSPPQAWSGSVGVNLTQPAPEVRRAETTTAAQNWIASSTLSTVAGITYATSVVINSVSGQHNNNTLAITGSFTTIGYYLNGVSVGAFATAQPGLLTVVWTATSSSANAVRIGIGCTGANVANAVCEFTQPRTVASSDTQPVYFPNTSTTAAYHAPRFDYDPTTLAPRGLLIEGSATNLALRSSDFNTTVTDGSSWTASGYSRGDVSTTLPDGTTGNACRISMASGSGSFRSASITVTASTAYTFSFWARNNGGSQARFRVWNVTAGSSIVDYTQTANNYVSQIGGANNTSSTWVRVSVSFTTPAGCTSIWVYPTSSDSGTVDLLVWGAQVETGSGPSSYIPTGSSTVQRASDSCSIALSSFGFNTTGGTFFADWYRKNNDAGTASGGPWSTDYATSRWFGVLTPVSSNTVRLHSWSGQTDIVNGSTRNKAAATYGAWTGSVVPATFCVNNSAVSSANRDFDPSIATYLTIGAASGSSGTSPAYGVATREWLNNSIRSIKYWPSILPDATLRILTT